MIEQYLVGIHAFIVHHVQRTFGALELELVRQVDQRRHVALLGDLQLGPNRVLLGIGLGIKPDLADRHAGFPLAILFDDRQHFRGQRHVVRLARVHCDTGEMIDPVISRALGFPVDDQFKIIDKRSHAGPRRTQPECRLNHGFNTRQRHPLVVVGDTGNHVTVRIDDSHG